MSGALLAGSLAGRAVDAPTIDVSTADSPGPITSGFRFNSDGTISENADGSYSQIGVWYTKAALAGIGANYQVRLLSSGKVGTWSSAAAADDVWVTMDSNREWNVSRTPDGSKAASATYEMRRVSTTTVLDSDTAAAEAVVLP